jgi:hypothetical protein
MEEFSFCIHQKLELVLHTQEKLQAFNVKQKTHFIKLLATMLVVLVQV